MTAPTSDGTIRFSDASDRAGREGAVDVDLELDGQRVSTCRIIPLRLRVGAASIRVDGISDVRTQEAFRRRGYARRVLQAALERMAGGEAALSMLYGITDFYPHFGYAQVGPDSCLTLPPQPGEIDLPDGWRIRGFRRDDLPAVRALYDRMTAGATGAAVRPPDGYPWSKLLASAKDAEDCRVIEDAGGRVVAYAWQGQHLGFVRAHSRFNPEDLVLAEAVADGLPGADLVLAVCRQWGAEEAARQRHDIRYVRLFMPPEGPVADAARHQWATFQQAHGPDGGWMARVLSTPRLLAALQPELSRRLAVARSAEEQRCDPEPGTRLRIETETGSVTLLLTPDGVMVEGARRAEGGEPVIRCRLPQTTLARLAMGAFSPEDLLARLENHVPGPARRWLVALFPLRQPQIYLADRF